MYRSTTPTLIFHIGNEEFDMDWMEECHVSIESESGLYKYRNINPEIDKDNKTVTVTLTQKETADFTKGVVKIQLKVKLKDGQVIPSKIFKRDMKEILEEEEM